MRNCLHCTHDGPDDTFATYKDRKGNRRVRNVCLDCNRFQTSERQARYKDNNPERVREQGRNYKYNRYWSDPEFRAKCVAQAKKQVRYP